MACCAVKLIVPTGRPRGLCSTSLPIFGFAGSSVESGTAKVALQKPMGDISETTPVVYTVYGLNRLYKFSLHCDL